MSTCRANGLKSKGEARRVILALQSVGLRHDGRNYSKDGIVIPEDSLFPGLTNVLYASDFSGEGEHAFAHALKLALASGAGLTLLHASEDREEWDKFPGVREMLMRWGLLPENSSRSAVAELGIEVKKVMVHAGNPVSAVLKYEKKHEADLIVMASHPAEGVSNWFHESVGEPVARESGAKSLFIPAGKEGFVSARDGTVFLSNILVPVAPVPDPGAAIEAAARLVRLLGAPEGKFTLLFVGKAEDAPQLSPPEVAGWTWSEVAKEGEVIGDILGAASGIGADLILMAADGRDGLFDAFLGSHSERVLRASPCPLLICPVEKQD